MSKLKIVQVAAKDKQAGSCSIMNTASIAAALPKLSSVPLKMVPSPPYFTRTLADLMVRRL